MSTRAPCTSRLGWWAVAVLGAAACGGQATIDTVGQTGAGAGAGTGTGVGAAGAGATGGAGGGGGEACSPACAEHERCIDGACEAVSYLALSASWRVRYDFANGSGQPVAPEFFGYARATRWTSDSGSGYVEVAAEGDCALLEHSAQGGAGLEGFQAEPGSLELTIPGQGTLEFDPLDDYGHAEFEFEPIAAGAVLSMSASGGADFVAASATVEMPEPIVLAEDPGPLVRGEPFTLSWTPSGAGEAISVAAQVLDDSAGLSAHMLLCTAPDSGALSMAGTLTAELDHESVSIAVIQLNRFQRSELEATAAAQVFRATASHSPLLFVEYQP